MIGWIEIIFTLIITSLIWLVIFKLMIKWGQKKMFNNMLGQIQKQDKTIINGGKPFDINEMMKEAGNLMATSKEKLNSPTSSGEVKRGSNLEFSDNDVSKASSPEDTKEKEVNKK